jgi:hypothetical protein
LKSNDSIVKSVSITNRDDECCGHRLQGVKVFVDGQLCGQFPSTTLAGQVYTVICGEAGVDEPIVGTTIRLETTTNEDLNFTGIEVTVIEPDTCFAFDYGPNGLCNAYKEDPLASYVGSGDENYECYNRISIPVECDAVYQENINIATSLVQIGI